MKKIAFGALALATVIGLSVMSPLTTAAAEAEIAREAFEHGTGARGLRAICERTLMDTMFELPDNKNIAEVLVTPEAVKGTSQPTFVLRTTSRTKAS